MAGGRLGVGRVLADAVGGLDLAVLHRLEHQGEVLAVVRVEFHAVGGLELRPMIRVGDVLEAGELVGQRAHVAAALHIVLAAQRHQPRAPTTDMAGEKRKVAQRLHVVDTVVVLGDAEGPEDLGLFR